MKLTHGWASAPILDGGGFGFESWVSRFTLKSLHDGVRLVREWVRDWCANGARWRASSTGVHSLNVKRLRALLAGLLGKPAEAADDESTAVTREMPKPGFPDPEEEARELRRELLTEDDGRIESGERD